MASNKVANASKITNKFFEETIIYQEPQFENQINQIRDAFKRGKYYLKINSVEEPEHESFLRLYKDNYTILKLVISLKDEDKNTLWFFRFGSIKSLRRIGFIDENVTEISDLIRGKGVVDYIAKITKIENSEYLFFKSPDLKFILDFSTQYLDRDRLKELGTFTKNYDIDEFPESKFTKIYWKIHKIYCSSKTLIRSLLGLTTTL